MLIIDGKRVNKVEKILSTQPFNKLNISLTSQDLSIVSGDAFEIRFHGPKDLIPNVKIGDERATIVGPKKPYRFLLLSVKTGTENFLEVTVPKQMRLEEVQLQLISGDSKLQGLSVEELETKSSSGNVFISNCQIEDGEIKTVSGNCNINRTSFTYLESRLKTGNNDISNCRIKNVGELYTISGNNSVRKTPITKLKYSAINGITRVSDNYEVAQDYDNIFVLETINGNNLIR